MNRNDQLILDVEQLIAEVDATHRYSMSRIYALYNQVFCKNETPQSCASCLIRRVRDLRAWLEEQQASRPEQTQEATTPKKRRSRAKKA